jgi:hypothetical protein
LKLVVISLIVFSIIILFLFALFPSDISVSRMVQINRPETVVRKKIADLRQWKWNEFLGIAFAADTVAGHSPGNLDSDYIHQASVSVDLLKATPDTLFTRWQHGNKSFTGNFILKQMNGQTMLQWTLYFHIKWYPWDKLASMFYEKQLGPVMEKSLTNLQQELESSGG